MKDAPQIIRLEVSSQDVIRALEDEVERLHELDTCCCGSPMNGHTWGDGHSPVSVYAYAMDCEQRNRDKAEAERDQWKDIVTQQTISLNEVIAQRDHYRKVIINLKSFTYVGSPLDCTIREALEAKP